MWRASSSTPRVWLPGRPDQLRQFCQGLVHGADSPKSRAAALELLTLLHDRRFDTGDKRRATVIQVIEEAIERLLDAAPLFGEPPARWWRRITWATRDRLAAPQPGEDLLVIDAQGFPPEGDDCDATLLRQAYEMGWKRFAVYRLRGQRFHGVGPGRRHGRRSHRPLRLQRRLRRQRHGWPRDPHPRQRPGPGGPDRQARKAGHLRRRRARPSCTAPREARSTSSATRRAGR